MNIFKKIFKIGIFIPKTIFEASQDGAEFLDKTLEKADGNKKVDDTNKENLLAQNFKAEKPSEKWVGDITYIYTKETGWTYLAIVMDLFDLKIIGWSYGVNMTSDLVVSAFEKAKIKRKTTKGMIFHSDLGSQYTSKEYEKVLLENNVKHSYSKKGYPYDNASMESFNAILKKEEVNVNTYATFKESKLAIFEFIESWYNNIRIHGSLNYKTPNEKYNEYIGLKWFVTQFLADKNFSIGFTYSLINILQDKGEIELYDIKSFNGYDIKAIKRKNYN